MAIKARLQYDDRPDFESDLNFADSPSLTKQADAKDCDINVLFARMEKGGSLPDMIAREPRYGDFSEVPDYQEACNIVLKAKEQFESLDAQTRNRFENDPAKFLAFANDPKNMDELEKLGLLHPDLVEARKVAREAADAAETAKLNDLRKQSEDALVARIKAELAK